MIYARFDSINLYTCTRRIYVPDEASRIRASGYRISRRRMSKFQRVCTGRREADVRIKW